MSVAQQMEQVYVCKMSSLKVTELGPEWQAMSVVQLRISSRVQQCRDIDQM